jgi:hypothetical protein
LLLARRASVRLFRRSFRALRPLCSNPTRVNKCEREIRPSPNVVLGCATHVIWTPPAPVGGARGLQWPGEVRNLSAGGIGVKLARRFEASTVLAVDVQGKGENDGGWVLGCAFTPPGRRRSQGPPVSGAPLAHRLSAPSRQPNRLIPCTYQRLRFPTAMLFEPGVCGIMPKCHAR